MMKKMKMIMLLASVSALCFVAGGTSFAFASAETTEETSEEIVTAYTVEEVTGAENGSFKMEGGASVRSVGTEKEKNGLKYTLTMSQEHYEGLQASVENGVYDDVSFGIFILPATFNETYAVRDYAFGKDVKYNWAVKNAETGAWEYTEEEGKVRITNLPGSAMTYDAKLKTMAFYGITTNILTENMGREMLGVGYMAYTVNGETNYVFTALKDEANNVRTMAYVAQAAIDDKAANASWLYSTYVKPVEESEVTYSYTKEYYMENFSGAYVLDKARTETAYAFMNETVNLEKEFVGYEFDETNENNVTSAKMVAKNGEIVLKAYYSKNVENHLIDVNEYPTLNVVEMSGLDLADKQVTLKLTAPSGKVVEVEDATSVVTASIPYGLYEAELKADGEVVYVTHMDVFDIDDGMVWQSIDEYSVNDSEILRGGYLKLATPTYEKFDGVDTLSFLMVAGEGSTTEVGMRLRALHSKEYYEMMSAMFSSITFDIYVTTGGINIEVFDDADGDGVNNDTDGVWKSKNTWTTFSVDINYILQNWETLNGVGRLKLGGVMKCQLFTTLYGHAGEETVYVGNFGSVSRVEPFAVEGVQLVETATTPTYNLLSLDTEGKLDHSKTYHAVFTASSGRTAKVVDAANVSTADIPQGLYDVVLKLNGADCMTAKVDIYTAADGVVWQVVDEYTVNDARVWKYSYNNVGNATFGVVNGVNMIQFTTVLAGEGNTNAIGLRLRALHSKEYYELMSEDYEAITFSVHATGGGLNIEVFDDADGDGANDTSKGKWHGNNKTVTYSVPLSFFINNWDKLNNLTTETSGMTASNTQIVTTYYGYTDKSVVSIGNFGCVAKTVTEE